MWRSNQVQRGRLPFSVLYTISAFCENKSGAVWPEARPSGYRRRIADRPEETNGTCLTYKNISDFQRAMRLLNTESSYKVLYIGIGPYLLRITLKATPNNMGI
jgi:hypothetical protein